MKPMVSPSDLIVDIENLTFRYDENEKPTLTDINLQIKKGEMVLLCGPTGCGKTTLALCLNGLIPFTTGGELSGKILVCGKNPGETPTPKMATKVGLVFQDPEGQLCTLFLEDEIAFGPENLLVSKPELSRRVDDLLKLISLEQKRHESVFELSGGQKQKVNIVSVMAMQPELLVFDMPTANLDPVGSAEVFQVIRRLVTEQDITCIIIENRLDDLVPLADRVVVMGNEGNVVYDGTPQEVFEDGLEILNDLGVEIPQIVELDLHLRQEDQHWKNGSLPLTVDEMINKMETQFDKHFEIIVDKNAAEREENNPQDIVSVENLHFSYRKGNEILKGLSYHMKKGELLAIVGNNGSGKTTMAKILVGLLKPSSGAVQVCGLEIGKSDITEIASKVAYVFQYPDHQFVAQGKAVRDEIAYNLVMSGANSNLVDQRVEELLELFNLKDKEGFSPFSLSGGEMRTLSVACMLSINPELLILDEPTYGQDERRISALMERLNELRREGTSVIMISHDMRLVSEYATSVLLFNAGKILFNGKPKDLFMQSDLLHLAALKEPPIHTLATKLSRKGYKVSQEIIKISDFLEAVHR